MAVLPHLARLEALLKRNRNHPYLLPPEEPEIYEDVTHMASQGRQEYYHHKSCIEFQANEVLQTNPRKFDEEYAYLKAQEVYLTGEVDRLRSEMSSGWHKSKKIRNSYFTSKNKRVPINAIVDKVSI